MGRRRAPLPARSGLDRAVFKLASQYPDLFGRAQTTVGPSGFTVASASTREQVDSLRNIPILMWAGGSDQSVPPADTQAQADRFDALGYRYEFDLFTSAISISRRPTSSDRRAWIATLRT